MSQQTPVMSQKEEVQSIRHKYSKKLQVVLLLWLCSEAAPEKGTKLLLEHNRTLPVIEYGLLPSSECVRERERERERTQCVCVCV